MLLSSTDGKGWTDAQTLVCNLQTSVLHRLHSLHMQIAENKSLASDINSLKSATELNCNSVTRTAQEAGQVAVLQCVGLNKNKRLKRNYLRVLILDTLL